MHLDPGRGNGDAEVGAPGLDHRDQQIGPALRPELLGVVGIAASTIDHCRGVIGERAHCLGCGAHPQQHPTHIGMVDDRRWSGIGRSAERLALHPYPGKVAGLLIGALGDRNPLHPDIEPGIVHHREHVFEAAIFLADPPADRVFIGEDAGRRGVDAELVLEAQGADRVARPRNALVIKQKFRHEKQRHPRDPGGAPGVRASTAWTMLGARSWSP